MSDLSLSWQERYAPRRALAKKYLADWPLQFTLQTPILHHSDIGREWDLAIEHYRTLPDRSLGELLEARLLSPLQRKKSREALDRILGLAKDSPWAHLAMLEWAADLKNGDRAVAEKEFEAFRRMCPGDLYVFRYVQTVRDPEKLRRHVEALRGAIELKKIRGLDEEDLQMLRTAWTFEPVTYGSDHREEFRKVVRSDLDYMRSHPMWDSERWIFLLPFGYTEVLKEGALVGSFPDEILKRAPKSSAAYSIRRERWQKENPPPAVPQPADPSQGQPYTQAQQAYDTRSVAFSLALLKDFWGQEFSGYDAGHLLSVEGVPADMVGELADLALSTAERFPDQGGSSPPLQFRIAEAYINRKIRLDQVPTLVEKGLEESENQRKYSRDSDAFDEAWRRAVEEDILENKRHAQEILIGHAIAIGQTERARVLLDDLRHQLDESKLSGSAAGLAASRGHGEFTYRMLARKAGLDVPLDFELLTARPEEERHPVASFQAKDLSGKTWSLADLQGKVTYVHLWRSGCGGPCSAGLQGVQQLYERWKNRSDRAVLTISQDENPAITESFMKENEYSFPMIYGTEIAQKFGVTGWPLELLIDPQGRRVLRHPPRASAETISKIEEIADKVAATQ
jgi:peroxiredoxin